MLSPGPLALPSVPSPPSAACHSASIPAISYLVASALRIQTHTFQHPCAMPNRPLHSPKCNIILKPQFSTSWTQPLTKPRPDRGSEEAAAVSGANHPSKIPCGITPRYHTSDCSPLFRHQATQPVNNPSSSICPGPGPAQVYICQHTTPSSHCCHFTRFLPFSLRSQF